jgi:hypothetical protein
MLVGGELRECFERATEPFGIKLAYGGNPYLSTGFGSDLKDSPVCLMRHHMSISPLVGMNDPNTRITPPVPASIIQPCGVNVSIIGNNRVAVLDFTHLLAQEFSKVGSPLFSYYDEPEERRPGPADIKKMMEEANIGIVIVRHLNAVRQMTVADFGRNLSSPPVLQPGEL